MTWIPTKEAVDPTIVIKKDNSKRKKKKATE